MPHGEPHNTFRAQVGYSGEVRSTKTKSVSSPTLEKESRVALCCVLTGLLKTARATIGLPTVFAKLWCKLDRLSSEMSAQPLARTIAICWVETGEMPIEIKVNFRGFHKSFFAREGS